MKTWDLKRMAGLCLGALVLAASAPGCGGDTIEAGVPKDPAAVVRSAPPGTSPEMMQVRRR